MSLSMRPFERNTKLQYDCKVRTEQSYFIYGGTEHEKELNGGRIHS